ncbi:alpha/beta fold hydrolase [Exiguobacterium sp. SH0S7]|uniref:alpha/beta hydrolase n=1 Tax=Exiguobacterium sp. SH0S7 TaxID=2510951 RepID=UPI00103D7E25|nr:alpha/beta fold hydrolase [Exiguobacterium sp. SH0S7]TCI69827.1 alpha/beta fold hydrolase [Exiguobacterium sp. SH0S7]
MERDMKIKMNYGELAGTLSLHDGQRKTVVILSGSGPSDRNGNVGPVQFNTYKKLADALYGMGVNVFRYDKQGIGESDGDFNKVGLHDLVNDAIEVVKTIQRLPKTGDVYVLGHSEGAVIAPAVQLETNAAGLILLAGFNDSSKQMFLHQADALASEIGRVKGLKGMFYRLTGVPKKVRQRQDDLLERSLRTNVAAFKYRGQVVNAKWIREHASYDVRERLELVRVPLLAITGDRDVQVPPEHVHSLRTKGDVDSYIIKDMNHLLVERTSPHSLLTLHKEYREAIEAPLHPQLLQKLNDWLIK